VDGDAATLGRGAAAPRTEATEEPVVTTFESTGALTAIGALAARGAEAEAEVGTSGAGASGAPAAWVVCLRPRGTLETNQPAKPKIPSTRTPTGARHEVASRSGAVRAGTGCAGAARVFAMGNSASDGAGGDVD
jgi:hypothetical protein